MGLADRDGAGGRCARRVSRRRTSAARLAAIRDRHGDGGPRIATSGPDGELVPALREAGPVASHRAPAMARSRRSRLSLSSRRLAVRRIASYRSAPRSPAGSARDRVVADVVAGVAVLREVGVTDAGRTRPPRQGSSRLTRRDCWVGDVGSAVRPPAGRGRWRRPGRRRRASAGSRRRRCEQHGGAPGVGAKAIRGADPLSPSTDRCHQTGRPAFRGCRGSPARARSPRTAP